MNRYIFLLVAWVVSFGAGACSTGSSTGNSAQAASTAQQVVVQKAVYTGWPETFETGSKGAYSEGAVTLSTGTWNLSDALIGSQPADEKVGAKAIRIEKAGMVTMNFDVTNGASEVTIKHAVFGKDAESEWQLWYSTNSGNTWVQTGGTTTTSSAAFSIATYTLNVSGSVRFQVRKLSGGRLNIDDFSITSNGGVTSGDSHKANNNSSAEANIAATHDDNMALGNPSGAAANASHADNYLMIKPQYALSYNSSKGTANWVSWHLNKSWFGSVDRCNCFEPDAGLPHGFLTVVTSNYSGSGFDRGHLCPSGDRTSSPTDNAATFLMTNMTPQAPNLNEVTWEAFESYCRKLAAAGNELYIIAGGYGAGGTGRNGGITNTIANGTITVPSHFWKIAVILPEGNKDASRVTTGTRVIAVDMPNTQCVSAHPWGYYRTSVDAIEAATGYDFLSDVPASVQAAIEAQADNGPTL